MFKGHDAVIRDDMIIEIPEREIKIAGRPTIRCMGRRIPIGDTYCLRCGTALYVEGVSVSEVPKFPSLL
jgi:hypothetical protein